MTRRHARPDQVSRRARSRPDRFAPPAAVAFGQSGPPLRATQRDFAGRGGETALQPNRETSNFVGINKRMRQERAGWHDQEANGSAQSNQGMDVFMWWHSSCHAGVEQLSPFQEDASDAEHPIGDAAQGAAVGMATCAQRLVSTFAFWIVLHCDPAQWNTASRNRAWAA